MKLYKSFKFRVKPNKQQANILAMYAGTMRHFWNLLVAENKRRYKEKEKCLTYKIIQDEISGIKKYIPIVFDETVDFYEDVPMQSLQVVGQQFDRAFKDAFKGRGFPKFRKKGRRESFQIPQGFKLKYHKKFLKRYYIFIPKYGYIRVIYSRKHEGIIKHMTVSCDGDQWYVSLCCEIEKEVPSVKETYDSNNIIGIDLGLKEFAVFSDGTIISNPQFYRKSEDKLKFLQRKLSKKKLHSKNYNKLKDRIFKLHRHIRFCRRDFLHKLTTGTRTKYSGFVLEDLSSANMMKNHRLAKSIGDVSWYEFRRQLNYKSRWSGKLYLEIGRFEPSSKMCSRCGSLQDMFLSKRLYLCPNCGLEIDRDLNAAINIRNLGLNTAGGAGINACGDEGCPSSGKQEAC